MIIATLLDRLTPYLNRIAFALIVAATIAGLLLVNRCTGQQAAQSKQDARSAGAAAETDRDALTTQDNRHQSNADLDATAEKGRQDVRKAKEAGSDVGIDAAGLDTLCKLSKYRDHAACGLRKVHP